MDKEKRNQIIVVGIILILLLFVLGFAIFSIMAKQKTLEDTAKIKLNQIYSSDYKLQFLSDKYFIGTYEDNKITAIIDNTGKEVYSGLEEINYKGIFVTKDGKYLIYSNEGNNLKTYIFDGKNVTPFYEIKNTGEVKPLLYKKDSHEYIIGFISVNEEGSQLFNLNDTGVIVLKNKIILGDRVNEERYYTYNENYLVVKDSESNLVGVIDFEGDIVIDYKYLDIVNTFNNSFIIKDTQENYGIIDEAGTYLLKPKNNVIAQSSKYYLVVNKGNKMALYDKDFNIIINYKMAYDDLIEYDLRSDSNSIKLYEMNDLVIVGNNYLENIKGREFNQHNLYVIKNKEIDRVIKEINFNYTDVLYTMDKDYMITVYDKAMNELSKFKVADMKKLLSINYVTDEVLKVEYQNNEDNNVTKYYNKLGEEVNNDIGQLMFKNALYSLYIKKNDDYQELMIYDNEFNLIEKIEGKYIDVIKEYIIIDNSIYQVVVS